MAESFFATLKNELIYLHVWPTRRSARSAIFAFIEGWYNRARLHSTLDYSSPNAYEEDYHHLTAAARHLQSKLSVELGQLQIVEVQSERVLSIDPSPDGIGSLAVGQILHELEHRDQCQAPRTLSWLTSPREQVRKIAVFDQ